MDGTAKVIVKPSSPLEPGINYTISIGTGVMDITGTPIKTTTFSFTVRPEIVVESKIINGETVDDLVVTSLPGNITITFDNPISETSVVRLLDQYQNEMPVEFRLEDDKTMVIEIQNGLVNGDYILDISGIEGLAGGPMADHDTIDITISVEEDIGPGTDGSENSGFPTIILIILIPLIMLILGAVAVVIFILRRGKEKDGSVSDPVTENRPMASSLPGAYGLHVPPPGKQ
jgi:methionine-rich copper-binding protein CopC